MGGGISGPTGRCVRVQDKIAATVVQRLKGTFFEGAVRKAKPTSVDAYQTYLAARALMRDPKKEPLTQAWRMARQIVDAHPDYAPGHALYASATWLLADDPYSYGDYSSRQGAPGGHRPRSQGDPPRP